jgi:hypothetical protein
MDLATFVQPALIEQRFLSTCIKQKVSGLVFFISRMKICQSTHFETLPSTHKIPVAYDLINELPKNTKWHYRK